MNAVRRPANGRSGAAGRRNYPAAIIDVDLVRELATSETPLTAYDLAERLSCPDRRVAVVTIYRSLARLCDREKVERIEMTSRYRVKDVAQPVLFTCGECGRTSALPAAQHHVALGKALDDAGFASSKIALEAVGICAACRSDLVGGSRE